jgi:predicted transcriptional regulator
VIRRIFPLLVVKLVHYNYHLKSCSICVLAFSKKRRRDSTQIIYEILLASKGGISKTKAVQRSNLNFHLMNEYLSFLLDRNYLERMPLGSSHDKLKLTHKGERLLDLLNELEREIKAFRTLGLTQEASGGLLIGQAALSRESRPVRARSI